MSLMKTTLLLILLPLVAFSQHESQYTSQQHADRIVSYFFGDEIFRKYITTDDHTNPATTGQTFKYKFRHSRFGDRTFPIALTVDSSGHLIPGNDTRGLVKIASPNDSSWVSARQAFEICRDSGRIKRKSIRLTWDSTSVSYANYERTHNLADIFPGNIVWQIDGQVLFRGDWYSGTFEVDALTGRLTKRFAIPWD